MIKLMSEYVSPVLLELRGEKPRWLASHLVMAWVFCNIPMLSVAMTFQTMEEKAIAKNQMVRYRLICWVGEVVCIPSLIGLVIIRAIVGRAA